MRRRVFDIKRGDVWDLTTNTGVLRRIVKSVACGRVSYMDADGRFVQCGVAAFKRWATPAFLTSANDWAGRHPNGDRADDKRVQRRGGNGKAAE